MPFPATADLRDLFLGESTKDGLHHAKQWDILSRIVQHPQKLQQLLHLQRPKISGLRCDVDRDSLLFQYLFEFFVPAAGGAKQDDHIRIPHRTQFSRGFLHHLQTALQLLDTSGNGERFQLSYIIVIHKDSRTLGMLLSCAALFALSLFRLPDQ